jgi:hypothetical protein
MMMSQRQSKVSFKELPDGNYIPEFKYLIPSGFIAKDEMSDNNFRNIFATLNYNHLKTKKNLYGLREYDFISLQPINLNGEFKNKVNNKKYNVSKNDNPYNDTPTNAKAYIRTIEENNQDYVLFRFGIDGKNRKLKSRFLIKEDGRYYLPSYENSYYFYYGIKNGATALDKFLTDYFAECPTRGEIFLPEINVDITDKIICAEEGKAVFEVKNVPIPFNYTLKNSDNIPINGASEMDMNKFTVTGLTPGAYTIEVENTMVGLTLKNTFDINETLPLTNEHNFYEDSCSMVGTNFDETPTIKYDESTLNFTITPKNNGGTITLNFPKPDTSKLAPYIYGFAITCDGYCVCHAFSQFSKPGNHTRVYETLCEELASKPIWLKKNIVKMVEDEEKLYNIPDNNINMLINDERVTCAFKGWQSNSECNLYICYGCSKIMSDFKIKLVDSVTLDINNRKMSYYIYNENVTLSEMELNAPETIFEKVQNTDERIVKLNYNKLHILTPREEWAIKRGLYFDESYYNGAYGKIQYGVVGGTMPYDERIVGTSEYLRSDGMLEMVEGVDNTKDGSIFPGGSCENCSKDEEVIDKDGSIFPGGSCDRCKDRKPRVDKKAVRIVEKPKNECPSCPMPEFRTKNYTFAAPRYKSDALNRNCCDLASFTLKHVDFKLQGQEGYSPYSSHVGNYRFRIFGCRRANKKAMLNHGRVIQKNMAFYDVFKKSVDKCYKVIDVPGDVCLADPNVKLPEYVLTAEITNFFMNVCDEYDWDKAKKANRRNGSAEMTVTWRLLNLSQTEVYWKGVTTGYADVENGVYEGEVKLADVMKELYTTGYSNVPVYLKGTLVGVINRKMLIDAIGKAVSIGEDLNKMMNKKVVDALAVLDTGNHYEVVSEKATIDNVLYMFQQNRKLSTVIITPSGAYTELPVGIVVTADIIDMQTILDNY